MKTSSSPSSASFCSVDDDVVEPAGHSSVSTSLVRFPSDCFVPEKPKAFFFFSSEDARTFGQVLQGLPHAAVEGSGVGRALEGQTAPPVVHLPVVERGRGLRVDQILLQETLQDHLGTKARVTNVHFV